MTAPGDLSVTLGTDHVAVVEMHRPPDNYFDLPLITSIARAYRELDDTPDCRAIVLCSEGKHFCAGANFSPGDGARRFPNPLYEAAAALFDSGKPVVAAVQGAAVGGGLGLACSADFRTAGPGSRFAANFARLGFHHGFGLTETLPRIVGLQHAGRLLLTGARIGGEEAFRLGLCEQLVPDESVRDAALGLARELAEAAPLAVTSIRATLRAGLADRFREVVVREDEEQARLRQTADWREGVLASKQRRPPRFDGR